MTLLIELPNGTRTTLFIDSRKPMTEPERKIIEYIINDTDSKTYERITKGIV